MGPRQIANILAAAGLAALVAVAVVAMHTIGHPRSDRALQKVLVTLPSSLLHANDFRWTQVKNGQKQWELTASEGSYSQDRRHLFLSGAVLNAVGEDGHEVVLHASRAVLELASNQIVRADMSGGLTIDYEGFELVTPNAVFFPDQDRLQAPGPVHVRGQGITADGIGMEAHLRERLFTLEHSVTTEMTAVKPANTAVKTL
jgi:LPS export ABC transporter protein LptC